MDKLYNELLATGALFGGLMQVPGIEVDLVTGDDGVATTELLIRFDFLKSQYRITVTQEPPVEVGGGQLG